MEWKVIPGFTEYEASDNGRVRNTRKELALSWHNSGRWFVWIRDDSNMWKYIAVHRLVLMAHVGMPTKDKPFGLHRDDDPTNNDISNLYWGTRRENSYDSVRNGNHVQSRKTTCSIGHLLIEPNLVESTTRKGFRACLACKLSRNSHNMDKKKMPKRYNIGRDGFLRKVGESFEEEAHRRYVHIMQHCNI
jgi:HNH endonuclease/NUMOD4 motif